MTIPVWPSDLPQRVQRDGYSQGFGDGRLKTAMEAGPAKMRRRYSSVGRPVQCTLDETLNAFARLERFWNEETRGGSLPFLMPDQSHDAYALEADDGMQLLDDQGRPLINTAWWLVVFGDSPPQAINLGGPWYKISFPLTILP